jgi:transcriptional regulator with XRE-family HTH domain
MAKSPIVAKGGFYEFPLRQLLRDRNVTQHELARRTGIKATYINRLVKGKTRPGWNTIMEIAAALELHIGDLENVEQL